MRLSRPRRLAVAVTALGAAGAVLVQPVSAAPEATEATEATEAYIVVLADDVARPGAVAEEHRRAHGAQVRHTYSAALKATPPG